MKKFIFLLLLFSNKIEAQSVAGMGLNSSLPSTCSIGTSTYLTTGTVGLYICTATNIWTLLSTPNNILPAGTIILKNSGTCPTYWSEVTALNGVMLRGTLAANGNVGTSGGNDTIIPTINSLTAAAQTFTGNSVTSSAVSGGTPSGTNGTVSITPLGTVSAPIFTGSPLVTHAHELPWQIPSTTTIRQIAVATFGTGTSRTATAVSGTGTSNTTSAAVALSQSVSAGTPAGTNSAPTFTGSSTTVGAETFTGSALGTHTHTTTATGSNGTSSVTGSLNSFDNRPAYTNVIFCSKD